MAIEAAKLMVVVGGDTSEAQREISSFSGKLEGTAKKAGMVGGILTAAVTVPLLGMGKAAISGAMDMESGLNIFQAVSGATADEIARVSDRAIDLGADLTLPATSAADATEAMVELAKAGLSIEDSLGAAKGVLQLSAAGALSNAAAAEIASNALNVFGLAGTEATRVADLLAAGANASSAEVFDLADSLKMSGAVFAAAGHPIEDLVTSIGLMANAGIKGSDAGTSLKQMMLSLQAPSDKAKNLMSDLGFSVYDLAGNMLPMRDIIGNLNSSMGDLTQEQRNAALATIFGSDAVRAANVLMAAGVGGFDSMAEAVGRQGAASDLAGARMKGLGGALEGLKSQLETVGTALASKLLPPAESIVRWLADMVGKIGDVNPQILAMVGAFLAVLAGAGPFLLIVSALAAGLAFLLSPIGLVVVGLAVLAAAFAGNVGGIRDTVLPVLKQFGDWLLNVGLPAIVTFATQAASFFTGTIIPAVQSLVSTVLPILQQVASFVQTAFSYAWVLARDAVLTFIQALSGDWTNAEGIRPLHQAIGLIGTFIREQAIPAIQELANFVTGTLWPAVVGFVETAIPRLQQFADWFMGTAIPAISEFAGQVQEFFHNVIAPAIATVVDDVLPKLIQAWDDISAEVFPTVAALSEIVATNFENIKTVVTEVLEVVKAIVIEVFDFVAGFIEDHGTTIKGVISEAWDFISRTIDNTINIVKGIILTVMNLIQGDWDGAWNAIKDVASSLWDQIKAVVEVQIGLLKGIVDLGMEGIKTLWGIAWDALKTAASEKLGEAKTAIDGVIGDIKGAFSGAGGWLYQAGKNIMQGLIDGITSMLGPLGGVLGGVTGFIQENKGPESVDKKLLYQSGQWIVGGLIGGMAAKLPQLKGFLGDMTDTISDGAAAAVAPLLNDGFTLQGATAGSHGTAPRNPVSAGYVAPVTTANPATDAGEQAGYASVGTDQRGPSSIVNNIYLPSGELLYSELLSILNDEKRRVIG